LSLGYFEDESVDSRCRRTLKGPHSADTAVKANGGSPPAVADAAGAVADAAEIGADAAGAGAGGNAAVGIGARDDGLGCASACFEQDNIQRDCCYCRSSCCCWLRWW